MLAPMIWGFTSLATPPAMTPASMKTPIASPPLREALAAASPLDPIYRLSPRVPLPPSRTWSEVSRPLLKDWIRSQRQEHLLLLRLLTFHPPKTMRYLHQKADICFSSLLLLIVFSLSLSLLPHHCILCVININKTVLFYLLTEHGLVLMASKEQQEEGEKTINPPSRTVSHNLRDCQNHRVTFESISSPGGQYRRWRPCSFDLNGQGRNVAAASLHPLSGGIAYTNSSCEPSMRSKSNMFPSPPTPNCWHNGVGVPSYQKGWSSERVPLPASRGQRYGGNTPLYPFNNGRTMPSKWEDAERWICSPVSGDGSRRPLMLPPYHRRPKSKSGPLGAPVLTEGSYPSASQQIPCFDNGRVVNFAGGSPFLAGVLVTDQQFDNGRGRDVQEGYEGGENYCSPHLEACIDQSTSMHGWLDMLEPSTSLLSSDGAFQGNRIDSSKEAATAISHISWRRDVGTQMSPEGSTHSSTKERHSLSHSPPSVQTITELQGHFPCLEIRDVQVDDRVTVTRWSKKHISRCSDRRSTDIIEWKRKTVESQASDWEVVDSKKHISKYDSEEAKIIAWENLQKAKAEAALHKLEMKLEKRRTSSMNKILNRLRSAQSKADGMRSSVVDRQAHLVPRTRQRISYGRMSSLRSCFTCRAF